MTVQVSGIDVTLADRIRETTQTTGTGSYSLDGVSEDGYQSFVDGVGNGNSAIYVVVLGTAWEIGIGTVTSGAPDTISRDTILASTNADAAIDWPSGVKTIVADAPAALLDLIADQARVDALEAREAELDGQIAAFAGTKMLFVQAAAPTGWTQDTSQTDLVLRIVDGTGGGTGGDWEISGVSVDGHTLTTGEIPSHRHTLNVSDAGIGSGAVDKANMAGTASTTAVSFNAVDSSIPNPHQCHKSSGFWRRSHPWRDR